jgi:hypothetical protein
VTERHWLALGVVGAGAVGLTTLYLFAKGRTQEALALSVATTLTSTVFAAARVLSGPAGQQRRVVAVYPSNLDVGPIAVR